MIKQGFIAICDECQCAIAYNADKLELINCIEQDCGFKCKTKPLDRDDYITVCKDCTSKIIKNHFTNEVSK